MAEKKKRRKSWKTRITAQAVRLASLGWYVHKGYFDPLRELVVKMGGTWEEYDGTKVAQLPWGPRAGFTDGLDPVTSYVQVCFLLLGQWWPFVQDAAIGHRLINEWWKQSKKAEGWSPGVEQQ